MQTNLRTNSQIEKTNSRLFVLAGVTLGMVALALRVGPPPSPDWTLHYVMLAGIAIVMVLTLLRRRSEAA